MLSPLLYTVYIHDCAPAHHSNTFVKFADDTTVAVFISRGDESNYRDEVEWLAEWFRVNNFLLNTLKSKELIVDFRRKKTDIQPLLIGGTCVERVSDFHFLGVNIMEDLTWSVHTTELVKKAQQRLYFLRVLRRNNIPQKLLVAFYMASWYTVCVCGFQAALWHRGRSSRGSQRQHRNSLAALSGTTTRTNRLQNSHYCIE